MNEDDATSIMKKMKLIRYIRDSERVGLTFVLACPFGGLTFSNSLNRALGGLVPITRLKGSSFHA